MMWSRSVLFLLTALIALSNVQPVQARLESPAFRQAPPAADNPDSHFPILARVYFTDEEMLALLARQVDVWEVQHSADPANRYALAFMSIHQLEALQRVGLRVVIDEAKTAQLYLQPLFAARQTRGVPGLPCYRTVEETYADLANLATAQPTLASWIDVGDSWNKLNPGNGVGYDIHVLVLTNRAIPGPKPKLFLMGAIHAREMTTAELATRFAEHLVSQYGRDPDVTWLLNYAEIHILPIANPDGRKRAEGIIYWRKNTNRTSGCPDENPSFSYYGVDLNRNSSFKWNQCEGDSACSTSDPCRETFRGSSPASEPETQTVQQYMTTLFPDQRGPGDDDAAPLDTTGVMISLHSYSQLVLFPWGWRATPGPNHAQLQTLGHKFGYFTHYKVCQGGAPGCIYQTDGTTDDWSYGELGVASYTFELGTAFFEQCSSFENTILPRNLPALLYAAKAAHRPYQLPAGPESVNVAVSPRRILSGTLITLTAQANDTRYRSNNFVTEPTQPIAAARYTLDTPSWITGAQSLSMTATDGLFDTAVETVQATVDTTGWPVGQRLLLVESQDADGNQGTPSGVFVEVLDSPYGVELVDPVSPENAVLGSVVTHTLTVSNVGLVADSYTVRVEAGRWPVSAPATVGPIAAEASASFTVAVSVPPTATIGLTDTATITLASQGQPEKQASRQVTTQATGYQLYFPFVPIVKP